MSGGVAVELVACSSSSLGHISRNLGHVVKVARGKMCLSCVVSCDLNRMLHFGVQRLRLS